MKQEEAVKGQNVVEINFHEFSTPIEVRIVLADGGCTSSNRLSV